MRKMLLADLLVLLGGCKAALSTYHYQPTYSDDPDISFQSGFEMHSWFKIKGVSDI